MEKEEAIKILKNFHDKSALFSVRTALETLHPELKESEDEKVRKAIIELVRQSSEFLDKQNQNNMIAWLEKQGEHKKFSDSIQVGDEVTRNSDGVIVNLSQLKRVAKKDEKQGEQNLVDKIEPKFKVGDWIISNNKKSTYQVIEVKRGIYVIRDNADNHEYHIGIEECEKSGRLWTIQDAKKGDILADKYGVYIYDQLDISDESACVSICGYQYSDKKFEPESMICNKSDFYPATKEQCALLFQKMKESGYEWLEETKELKKIELSDVGHEYYSELLKNDKSDNIADYAYQCVYCMSHDWAIENPTWDNVQSACRLGAKWQKKHDVSEDWSEEDEKMIGRVRGIIEAYAFSQSAVDVNGDLCEKKFIDVDIWLKSLKDRVQPKQEWSEEDEKKQKKNY